MTVAPASWTRAVLAVALLACIAAGWNLPTVVRWTLLEEQRAANATADAQQLRAILARAPAISGLRDSQGARFMHLGTALLNGEAGPQAGASLAALVTGIAAQSGLTISSVEPTSDTLQSPLGVASVTLVATGDVQGLSLFLQRLASGTTALATQQLDIEQPAPGADAHQAEALRIRARVSGLFLNRHPPLAP